MRALAQNGKKIEHTIQRPRRVSSRGPAQHKIFLNRKRGNNAASLRNHGNAVARRMEIADSRLRFATEAYFALHQIGDTEERVDHSRLANTITPENGNALAFADGNIHFVQDARFAIARDNFTETEKLAHTVL